MGRLLPDCLDRWLHLAPYSRAWVMDTQHTRGIERLPDTRWLISRMWRTLKDHHHTRFFTIENYQPSSSSVISRQFELAGVTRCISRPPLPHLVAAILPFTISNGLPSENLFHMRVCVAAHHGGCGKKREIEKTDNSNAPLYNSIYRHTIHY